MTGAPATKLRGVLLLVELLLLLLAACTAAQAEAEQAAAADSRPVDIIDPYRNSNAATQTSADDDELSDVLSQLSQTEDLGERSAGKTLNPRPIGSTLQTSARTLCGLSLKLLSGHDKQKAADSEGHIARLLMHTSRLCTHLSEAESGERHRQQGNGPLDLFVAGIEAFCTQLDAFDARKESQHGENKNIWELSRAVCSQRPSPPPSSSSSPPEEERRRGLSQSEAADFCRGVVKLLVQRSRRQTTGGGTSSSSSSPYGVLLMRSAAMCSYLPRGQQPGREDGQPGREDGQPGREDGDADAAQEASPVVKVAAGHFCRFLPKILARREGKEREERFAGLAMKSSRLCSHVNGGGRGGAALTPHRNESH